MNRFEALNILGLEEAATDDDVRLAFYGLEKAVQSTAYGDDPRVNGQVDGLMNRAKEARDFLLSNRNKTAATRVRAYTDKRRGPVKVSPIEAKTAQLHGYERLRTLLMGVLSNERYKRNMSILALLICVVVGFILLKYLRLMQPRIIAFIILAAVAIAGSSILTSAQMRIRRLKPYVLDLDAVIINLRLELGLDLAEGDGKLGVTISVPEEMLASYEVEAEGGEYSLPESAEPTESTKEESR